MLRKLSQEESSISSPSGGLISPDYLRPPFRNHSLHAILDHTPVTGLTCEFDSKRTSVDVLRLDLLDDRLGGNKLFKLWGHLENFYDQTANHIASFGGAYSNHLYALAALGQRLNISTIGFVRGEKPLAPSATLLDLESMGMKLYFLSRKDYRAKNDPIFLKHLARQYNLDTQTYWIGEGGGGEPGLLGCEALGQWLANSAYSNIVIACGTGTTMAGICRGLGSYRLASPPESDMCLGRSQAPKHVYGVSALRSDRSIVDEIHNRLRPMPKGHINWTLTNQFHHGGFAKLSSELQAFMADFYQHAEIRTDRVYTGKVFYALNCMIESDVLDHRQRTLVIHTGGLQGDRTKTNSKPGIQ